MKKTLQIMMAVLFANFLTAGSRSSGGNSNAGGGGTPVEPAKPGVIQIAGKWAFKKNGVTYQTMTLRQSGTAITGNDRFGAPITGTISGTSIKLLYDTKEDPVLKFQGTVNASGTSISGTYQTFDYTDLTTVLDSGTWTATKL